MRLCVCIYKISNILLDCFGLRNKSHYNTQSSRISNVQPAEFQRTFAYDENRGTGKVHPCHILLCHILANYVSVIYCQSLFLVMGRPSKMQSRHVNSDAVSVVSQVGTAASPMKRHNRI